VGTVTPTNAVIVSLTGIGATASINTVAPSIARALVGESASGAVGSVSTGTATFVAITGVSASGSTGTLAPTNAIVVSLTGIEAASMLGVMGKSVTRSISGLSSAASVGAASPYFPPEMADQLRNSIYARIERRHLFAHITEQRIFARVQ
jgi:hypothetical protein